jgi:ABC-type antimicrobial peptide transport system permease subunit
MNGRAVIYRASPAPTSAAGSFLCRNAAWIDLLLSLPLIILALVVVAVLGSGTTNVIVSITVPM